MAFLHNLNNTVNIGTGPGDADGFPTRLWEMVQDFITQGWQVLGSGNGSVFENDGQTGGGSGTGAGGGFDVWDTSDDAWQTSTAGAGSSSWIRLKTPVDAAQPYELVFWLTREDGGVERYASWRIEVSRLGAADTAGSAGEAPVSATADESVAIGQYGSSGRTAVQADYPRWTDDACTMHWIIGDSTENYDFVFFVLRGDGNLFSMFGSLYLAMGNPGPLANDVDQHVWLSYSQLSVAASGINSLILASDFTHIDGSDTTEENRVGNGVGGCFASLRYQAVEKRTYRVGLLQPHGYTSGSSVSVANSMPAEDEDDAAFDVLYSPIWFGKFQTGVQFLKGTYQGNLMKLSLDPKVPVKLDNGSERFANIHGLVFTWDPAEEVEF